MMAGGDRRCGGGACVARRSAQIRILFRRCALGAIYGAAGAWNRRVPRLGVHGGTLNLVGFAGVVGRCFHGGSWEATK